MNKTIVLFLLSCFTINGLILIPGLTAKSQQLSKHPRQDSFDIIEQVKNRQITYLLGGSGNGTYRQKAVREIDDWVETVIAQKYDPLKWDNSAELIMNDRINELASNLRRLAIVFRSAGSRYRENKEVKRRIIAGLENILVYYYPSSPRPGNWHPWLIGLPNNLGSTALLMESYLPENLLLRLKETLRDQLTDYMILTGTNAAWESRNHIYLALLDKDVGRLKRAADYVFRTVRYGTKQGVREDYCYLFHGRIPYAGAYGAGFAQTIAEFIYVFDGTPFAISSLHLDLVVNLLLDHSRWFLMNGQIDLHVRGRVFERHGSWNPILETLLVLSQADNLRSLELSKTALTMLEANPEIDLNLTSAGFADGIMMVDSGFPTGFRYWPSGEIGVYKQPAFHIGFRQYSDRVQDYEYLNRSDGGEGEEGWNLAYGFTNIIRENGLGSWYSKNEDQAMLPDIDLEHLPGTTSRLKGNPVNPRFQPDPDKLTMSTTGFSLNFGTSPFAGGAGFEHGGVAGFILEPAFGEFTAKKSLHFFPDGFWALGSGIRSMSSSSDMDSKPVHTTVLQWVCSTRNPELIIPGHSINMVKDTVTVFHDLSWLWIKDEQIGVVFHEPVTLHVRLISEVITIWLDHGTQPKSAQYAYAVLPESSLDETKRFANNLPFKPVRYDENSHAVREINGQSKSVVFFTPDSCLGIKSQSPAIVYWKGNDKGGIYAVQDPLHQDDKMKLTVPKLTSKINTPYKEVAVNQYKKGQAHVEISTQMGRVYRFGYGKNSQDVPAEPRKNLDLSSYNDFHVDATSDAEKTILTIHLPDEAVRNGYQLSVHFSKSQRLHDFTDADIVDRPTSNTVRYRWNRNSMKGPSVFSKYWNVNHGRFSIYLVTQLTEQTDSFTVPKFE